jgi:hypothetical protein
MSSYPSKYFEAPGEASNPTENSSNMKSHHLFSFFGDSFGLACIRISAYPLKRYWDEKFKG